MSWKDDADAPTLSDTAPPMGARSGLRIREGRDGTALWLRLWSSRMYAVPVALFTFLWLRFLWRWYALVLLASADDSRGFLLVFGLPFVLAGISLIGTSLKMVAGSFRVSVDGLRLEVVEEGVFGTQQPPLVAASAGIVRFVAECSAAPSDEDRELDAWYVSAEMSDGAHLRLPLPVRSLEEARYVAWKLDRALRCARTPTSYRG